MRSITRTSRSDAAFIFRLVETLPHQSAQTKRALSTVPLSSPGRHAPRSRTVQLLGVVVPQCGGLSLRTCAYFDQRFPTVGLSTKFEFRNPAMRRALVGVLEVRTWN